MKKSRNGKYSSLDIYLSPGLCRLSDLTRIGGHFVPTEILQEKRTCVLMRGRLSLGGKAYTAVVKAFSDSRPVVLFDVQGENETSAKENLKSVRNQYFMAKTYNVNGIRDCAHRRMLCLILYTITAIITMFTSYVCALLLFCSDGNDAFCLFSMIVSLLCFLAARVYYLDQRDKDEYGG